MRTTRISQKVVMATAATVLATTLLLGGTFAWQSISQLALNENRASVNPGGRLHDDYNGITKNVYVENFTEETGGGAIIARVRLDEYMEIGTNAGNKEGDATDGQPKALVGELAINEQNKWTTYVPAVDENGKLIINEESAFRDYVALTFGSSKTIYYMPTFNKNQDSLAADINGTYAGSDKDYDTAEDAFRDYVDWTAIMGAGDTLSVTDTDIARTISVDSDEDGNLSVTQQKEAIYDADTDTNDEGDAAELDTDITKQTETHTAAPIDPSKSVVISMQQWLNDYQKMPGNYWVYDTDGWAYWANLLEPEDVTGLLLSKTKMIREPDDDWYYGMNVVGQFVTAGDVGKDDGTGFYNTEEGLPPTTNAKILLALLGAGDQITAEGIDENGVLQMISGDTRELDIASATNSETAVALADDTIATGWSSTNEAVVSVNQNGEVTAKKPGEAIVIYTAGGVVTAIRVNVDYKIYTIEQIDVNGKNDPHMLLEYGGESNTDLTIKGQFEVGDVHYRVAVGSNAFYNNSDLTSVTFMEGVTSIDRNAFARCRKVTSVKIPASVTNCDSTAFRDCSSLPEFIVNDGNENYCVSEGILFTRDMRVLVSYPPAKDSKSYSIPLGVEAIAPHALRSCTNLNDITIPDSVTSIGSCAFYNCIGLNAMDIPASVNYIGYAAFAALPKVTELTIDGNNDYYCVEDGVLYTEDMTELIAYPMGKTGESFVVPDSVTQIWRFAFYGCRSITDIVIPSSVVDIQSEAFRECSGITNVYYTGTDVQWGAINIGTQNTYLTDAKIHYNHVPD